jgi:hypothetical protein
VEIYRVANVLHQGWQERAAVEGGGAMDLRDDV